MPAASRADCIRAGSWKGVRLPVSASTRTTSYWRVWALTSKDRYCFPSGNQTRRGRLPEKFTRWTGSNRASRVSCFVPLSDGLPFAATRDTEGDRAADTRRAAPRSASRAADHRKYVMPVFSSDLTPFANPPCLDMADAMSSHQHHPPALVGARSCPRWLGQWQRLPAHCAA